MKKIFLILILLSAVMLPAFSDPLDSRNFEVTTTISPRTAIKILAGDATVPSLESDFDSATVVTTHNFLNASNLTVPLNATVYTNLAGNVSVKVTAPNMKKVGGSAGDTEITYRVDNNESGSTPFTLNSENLSTFTARIFNTAFSIEVSAVSYGEATAGSYKADLTFEVIVP
ncbi:MAG: hypothetical protein WDA09_08440 [Bacteriovoracaceae bacterium]|jgi:hypothetical protein